MRLPYSIRKKIDLQHSIYAPKDWSSRTDWINLEGVFQTPDGQFKILEDPKYGLVIAAVRIAEYGMGADI